MKNRGSIFGETAFELLAGTDIASIPFTAADGTNINTLSGTGITAIETDVSSGILEVEGNQFVSITNGANGVARSTNSVRSVRPIAFYYDIYRGSVDSTGANFAMIVFADSTGTIASHNGGSSITIEGIGYNLVRDSSTTVLIDLYVKRPGGTSITTNVKGGLSLPSSSGARIWFVLEGNRVRGWKEDQGGGGTQYPFAPARIAGNWNDGTHNRIFFKYGTGSNQAGRFFIDNLTWQQ
jgi:hypothetical protein